MDWVAENLILLANDPREISHSGENPVVSEKESDLSSKWDIPIVWEFVQPPNKADKVDDEGPPLRWSIQKQRESKGKKKVVGEKVARTYLTRRSEKKLLGDVIRTSKSSTAKRKKLKKTSVVEDENV